MIMVIGASVANKLTLKKYIHILFQAKTGPVGWEWIRKNAGMPHDQVIVERAAKEVEEFCRILEHEGVKVRRPEPMRWDELGTFNTPYFKDGGGYICLAYFQTIS